MMMNLRELGVSLEAIGVPEEIISLGQATEMCWCVSQNADGAWETYWRERGNKIWLVTSASEEAACHQLLGRLTHSQLLAGVISSSQGPDSA